MDWNISFSPQLPLALIAFLLVAGAILVALTLWTRGRGWPLRLAAFALLALALFNPSIRSEDREYLNDIAITVVDRSQSQGVGARPDQTTQAEQAVKNAVSRLGGVELRSVTVRPDVLAEQDGTALFSALNQAMADVPPERFAGAVFITDGQVHDVPQEAEKLQYGAPIHSLLTGSRDEIDRRVVIEQAPRFGIVGKEQIVRFRVEQTGNSSDPVAVTVTNSKGETQTLNVQPGASVELPILIDHGGQNIAEISAAPLQGEITEANNRAVAVIEGIRDRLRVLLVSGEPHPGERTWRNLLKADASVDLVHFTILRPPEKQDGTPIKELSLIAFPTRELFVEKLDQFDLIIFDRYSRQGVLPLAYLSNVADYVDQGGAVLLAAGPDFASPSGLYSTPLSAVLSTVPTGQVLEGAYRPQLTQSGQRHPVTSGLPGSESKTPSWGRWFRIIETDPGKGTVLMSGLEDKPLLVLSRQGEGRVAQLLSDHGWLWARGYDGGGPQTELLRRLAHWLMKEPDLEEEALTGKQNQGQLIVERRTMEDTAQPVTVTAPSGAQTRVTLTEQSPGLWRGSMEAKEAGLHRLDDGTLKAVAAIGSGDPKETADILATEKKMQPAARATGGGLYWLTDGLPQIIKTPPGRQMAGSGWLGLKANGAYRVRAATEIPLTATLLALALLLAAICAMWFREGR